MVWNVNDYRQFSGQLDIADQRQDKWDGFTSSFEEARQAGPFESVKNLISANSGEKNITGHEANQKYELSGTSAAFPLGDEVSDAHAQRVADRHLTAQSNQLIIDNIEEDHGAIGWVTNAMGGLGGGMADPLALTAGVGGALAFNKLGTMVGSQVLRDVVSQQTLKTTFQRQLIENFVIDTALETGLVAASDSVMNVQTSAEHRVYSILGSTLLGGGLGTLFELPRLGKIKSANKLKQHEMAEVRKTSQAQAKAYGDDAPDIMNKSIEKGIADIDKGIKPNPQHEFEVKDSFDYGTRPGQDPYVYVELGDTPVSKKDWYVSRTKENQTSFGPFHKVSDHGRGVMVVTDNFNLHHNRVHDVNNKGSGVVYPVTINDARFGKSGKVSSIIGENGFTLDVRTALRNKLRKDSLATNIMEPAGRKEFLDVVRAAAKDSETVVEFKRRVSEGVKNYEGIDSIDELINKTIKRIGFEGYHFVGRGGVDGQHKYNGIAILDSRAASLRNEVPTTKFDGAHPDAEAYLRPAKDMEKAEVRRSEDPTQKKAYSQSAVDEVNEKAAMPKEPEGAKDFLERQGIELENLDQLPAGLKAEVEEGIVSIDNEPTTIKAANYLFGCLRKKFFGK